MVRRPERKTTAMREWIARRLQAETKMTLRWIAKMTEICDYAGLTPFSNVYMDTSGSLAYENANASDSAVVGGDVPTGFAFNQTVNRTATTITRLRTGGKPSSTARYIFQIESTVTASIPPAPFVFAPPEPFSMFWQPPFGISNTPPQDVRIGSYGYMDTNGALYQLLSDNADVVVTPTAAVSDYVINEGEQKYKLVHKTECTAVGNTNDNRTTIGVGEAVDFSGMPGGTTWSVSGNGIISTNKGGGTTFTASMSPGSATITATIDNVTNPTKLSVVAPSGVQPLSFVDLGLTGYIQGGNPGSDWIGASTIYYLQVLPNTVSFGNLNAREVVPEHKWLWPDGETTFTEAQTNQFSGVGCDTVFTDKITDGPLPIYRLSNGTNYVSSSFPQSWVWQYQNQNTQWVNCATISLMTTYSSNAQCQETYQGMPSGWQGPWQ